jgi:hypothetical protein
MSLSRREQADDGSCAAYAIHALLTSNHIRIDLWKVRRYLNIDPKLGTSHEQIVGYLLSSGIPYFCFKGKDARSLPTPCLVNYQWEGEGHYGVVTRVDPYFVSIISNGNLTKVSLDEFHRRWYSERYGQRWALRLLI